jgi:transposase
MKGKTPTKSRTKTVRPRASTLANFKGTRKELAKKYGVSERTVYRWINKAKEKGAEITGRSTSKYPGSSILDERSTNKELAKKYGVSERTIYRWKKRAWNEAEPWEVPEPENKPESNQPKAPEPENIETPEPEEIESDEPWEVPDIEEEYFDEYTGNKDFSDDQLNDLKALNGLLIDNDLIDPNSLFMQASFSQRMDLLDKYIEKRVNEDPELFYNEETGEIDTSPEFVSTVPIWGNEFEKFLIDQIESDNYTEHD